MKDTIRQILSGLNRFSAGLCACTIAGLLTCAVFANPVLDHISAGNVSVQQNPGTTVVNQSSQKAIINWQSFNISHGESTHFNQPAGGVALNRISPTQGASQVYGSLTATGQLILINPAGIYFGPSAYVNVGGLIATSANLSDQHFMDGLYQFSKVGAYSGAIVNEGQIVAAQHGLVALVAPGVVNKGMIQANLGKVVLASGDAFTLNFSGDNLINFAITAKTSSRGIDKDGNPLPDGVNNTGGIFANGGTIILSAQAAAGILDHMINMEGIAQTQSVYEDNGQIILSSDPDDGIVRVAGSLDASGKDAGETGGNITITGHNILLDSPAFMDVSGDAGGGDVFVGGNYQGKGPLPNTNAVVMTPNAIILADAITTGHGGNIILWSDNVTKAYGNISAKGGVLGGDGGFIETSSKHYLDVNGLLVDARAPSGKVGSWLLDPTNIYIATNQSNATAAGMSGTDTSANTGTGGNPNTFAASGAVQDSLLTTGNLTTALGTANVIVSTTNASGTGLGDITIVDPFSWASTNSLTLTAANNIAINGAITTGAAGSSLILNATANVTQTAAIGGSGSVTKQGAGTATFSQTNTYTGGTNIQSGVLSVATLANQGSNSNIGTGTVLINGGTLSYTGSTVSVNRNYSVSSNGGTLQATNSGNTLTLTGTQNIAGSGGGANPLTINVNAGNITLNPTTITTALSNLTVTGSGTGTLTLSKTGIFTGTSHAISGGTLKNGVANALPVGSTVTITNPGTYDINGVAQTVASLLGTGTLTNSGAAATFTDSDTGTTTFSGTISGALALTKSGTGTITLSGNNSYTGATTVSAGILNLQSTNALGATSGQTSIASGAAIQIDGSGLNIAEPISSMIGTGVSTNGALRNLANSNTWSGAIVLGAGGATIMSSAGTLNITGGITGATRPLTIDGSGNTTFTTAAIGTTSGTLTKNGSGTLTLGFANTFTGATSINNGIIVVQNNTSLGTTAGTTSVASGAAIQIDGSGLNIAEPINTLIGTGISSSGALINIANNNTWSGAITLGAAGATITSSGGALTLGTVNAAQPLTLSGAGSFIIGSAIGAITPLSTLTANSSLTFNNSITTTGNQIYNAAATLNVATVTLNAGAGDINFASTVDSASSTARSLVLNSTGTTTLNGLVGSTFALNALTTNASGTTNINSGSVITTGAQTYNDDVRISADTTLNAGAAAIAFGTASTLNSSNSTARSLTLTTTSTSAIGGVVGGVFPLNNLTISSGGSTTTLNASAITTNGNMLFNNAVSLATAAKVLTSSTGSITFGSTVNGGQDLTLNATNGITFNGIVGGSTPLGNLTLNNDVNINANITTTGNQTYNNTFSFTGNRTLTSGSGANIHIVQPLTWTGTKSLSLTANATSGTLTLPSSITASSGTLTLNASDTLNSINASAVSIDVGTFNLQSGRWVQISASLPLFNATNFTATGDRFVRALAGDGSSGTPYQITDIYGLQGIGSGSHTLSSNFILANSIDLAPAAVWNSNAGWAPMGSTAIPFAGSFNGNNYTLNHLTMSRAGQSQVGLFNESDNTASFSNLNMTNINISVGTFSGALVGRGRGSFSNINLSGTITANAAFVGFLSGRYNSDATATATNIITSGTLNSSSTQVGGIFGSIRSNNGNFTMSNSSSSVNVSGTTDVGGLVGEFQGNNSTMSITSSHATGNVSGTTNVGGLIGRMQGNTLNPSYNTVSNSYSSGNVTGTTNVGGLVGQMTMQATGSGYNAVTNSYSSSAVTGTTRVGGLVGYANSSSTASTNDMSNSYSNGSITTSGTGFSIGGLVGQTADIYSTISSSYSNIASITNTTGADNIGGLVGTSAGTITGSHSITNLIIANGSTSVGGLLGSNSGSVTGSYATGTITNNTTTAGLSGRLGGLIGDNSGSVSNSHASGSITSAYSGQIGGLIGQNSGSISNSYSTGAVTGTTGFYFGGLVGQNNSTGTISNSFSSSQITGLSIGSVDSSSIGGLVGYNDGSISQSYATGAIIGNTAKNLGGLVGWNVSGSISNAYSTGTVTGISTSISGSALGGLVGLMSGGSVTNSYSIGTVSADAGYTTLGGLVGSLTSGTVSNSYWDTQSSGQSSSAGGTGLATSQMMSQANFSGWNFSTVWNIVEGQSYPFLRAFYSTAPRAISGLTPAAGGTAVTFASNGGVLDTVYTSANGGYYFLAGNNLVSGIDSSIADGTAILAYLNSGSVVGNAVALAPTSNGSLSNFNITANNITVGTSAASSMSNSSLATAVGVLTPNTILYSALGNAITVGNTTYKNVAFNTTANTTYNVNGNIISTAGTTNSSINFNAAPAVNTTATLSAVTVNFINGLTGNGNLTIAGAGDNNTLSMKSSVTQLFNVTGSNSGNASNIGSFIGTIAFNNIQNIIGGDYGNTFNFANNAIMSGTLNGGNLNSTNTINLTSYNTAIKVILSSTNDGVIRTMSDSLITTFSNITHINPNGSYGNTLYSPSNKSSNIYITAGRAGYINDPIYFTGVNSLISFNGGSVNFLTNAIFDPITGLYTVDGVTMSLSGFNSISGYSTTPSISVSNVIQQPPTNANQSTSAPVTSSPTWVLAGTSIDQNLTTIVTDVTNQLDNDMQKVKINPYCYTTR